MKVKVNAPGRQYKPNDENIDENIPSTKDMESEGEGYEEKEKGCIDKAMLKQVMAEISMEDRLKYSVDCKSVEELECLKKMCDAKIAELKKNPVNKSTDSVSHSKY